jgi:hypothetical protein
MDESINSIPNWFDLPSGQLVEKPSSIINLSSFHLTFLQTSSIPEAFEHFASAPKTSLIPDSNPRGKAADQAQDAPLTAPSFPARK